MYQRNLQGLVFQTSALGAIKLVQLPSLIISKILDPV